MPGEQLNPPGSVRPLRCKNSWERTIASRGYRLIPLKCDLQQPTTSGTVLFAMPTKVGDGKDG